MVAEFIENLSELAHQDALEPAVGREEEMQRIIEILCRAKRCHPIVLGRSGVGCSAVVKGLAQYMISHSLPARLQNLSVKRINFDLLFTCTTDLTETLNHVLETIYDEQNRVILVLDRLSALLETDESICRQMLVWIKRIFASFEVRVILVSDPDFYHQHLKSDAYLLNHCVPVNIEELQGEKAIAMVKAHLPKLQSLYQIEIPDALVTDVVNWSQYYLFEKPLPTSALELLDVAAAAVCAKQEVPRLTRKNIADIVSEWKSIEVNFLLKTQEEKIQYFATELSRDIYGQPLALQRIEQAIQAMWLNLSHSSSQPVNLLFVGPAHVGKSTAAEAMACVLYGTPSHLLRFELQDYQTEEAVSALLGSLEGDSKLISQLIQHPFSICVFERFHLAHPKFIQAIQTLLSNCKTTQVDLSHHIFIFTAELDDKSVSSEVVEEKTYTQDILQLVLTDLPGTGVPVESSQKTIEEQLKKLEPILSQHFDAEFLQQMVVVPFMQLCHHDLIDFFERQLQLLRNQLQKDKNIQLQVDAHFAEQLLNQLPTKTMDSIKQCFAKQILPVISPVILSLKLQLGTKKQLTLGLDENGKIICRPTEILIEETV